MLMKVSFGIYRGIRWVICWSVGQTIIQRKCFFVDQRHRERHSIGSRRFWTRNRPGDTVLERGEDGALNHPTRADHSHRDDLDHDRLNEEHNMPGLGLDGGLLEQLQQQGTFYRKRIQPSVHPSLFVDESFQRRELGIPGLDPSNDDEESRRRRVGVSLDR